MYKHTTFRSHCSNFSSPEKKRKRGKGRKKGGRGGG